MWCEEAAERVPGDVEGEERRGAQLEALADVDQNRDADEVPDQLVEERRVIGGAVEVLERPVGGVDLQPPREVGGLAEELLVPPVANPPDALGEQEPGRGRVHEEPDVGARAADDDGADERPERDPAPDSEPALPDLEDALPLRARHLAPGGDVVVEAGADDAEADAPDGHARHELPVAAHPDPPPPGQPDARENRDEQRQPVHVERQRPKMDDARMRAGDRSEHRALVDHVGQTGRTWPAVTGEPGSSVALAQDVEGEIGGAALLEQFDRQMQVDVATNRQLCRGCRRVTGPLQLRRPPRLDELLLRRANVGLGGWHLYLLISSDICSVKRTRWFSPYWVIL